jgi:hypothetical protein
MSKERANDLARLCTDVMRKGEDFPTVWQTLLKSNPLVEGFRGKDWKAIEVSWRFD